MGIPHTDGGFDAGDGTDGDAIEILFQSGGGVDLGIGGAMGLV